MAKSQKSYRFSKETFDKLKMLTEISQQQADTLGLKGQNETEIIEEAIDQLYTMKIDAQVGSAFLNRVELSIQRAINDALNIRDESLNTILFNQHQIMELLYLFAKFNKDLPRDDSVIRDVLYNKKSVYEDYIPNVVNVKLSEKK